jgi:hypothetical protein
LISYIGSGICVIFQYSWIQLLHVTNITIFLFESLDFCPLNW